LLKLTAAVFRDFVDFFPLRLVQTHIIVEFIDVALRALHTLLRICRIWRAGYTSRIEVCNEHTGGDANKKHAENQNFGFQVVDDHYWSSAVISCCSTTCLAGTSISL